MVITTCDFDTHSFVKKLVKNDMAEKQAEAIIEILHEMKQNTMASLVTKEDIFEITKIIQKDIETIKQEVQKLELRMTIRFGTMIACLISMAITILKLL